MDEKGQVCLPIISAENWKPATKTDQGKILFEFDSYKKRNNIIIFIHSTIDLLYF